MAWGDWSFSWPSFFSSRTASSSSSSSSCNVSQGRSMPELYEGIANFYDESSGLWEDMWGEHMHHGYYDTDSGSSSQNDHRLAQITMIENSLAFAQVPGKFAFGQEFFFCLLEISMPLIPWK
jgi:tocopherol O-methyltransferase